MDDPNIHHQLIVSAIVIAATTFVHGVFVAAAAAIFRASKGSARGFLRFFRDSTALVLLGLWLMFAHMLEMAMWAWTYLRFDLFDGWEPALYFSAASYTTLGFGDVLLPESWRLLSGATAANGLLLFGLSAAFLFNAAGQLHLSGAKGRH
ncbi:ion channel [Hyphococcus flavus]|uniref:Ion channel n=1 Tax=Hyphococcus flavus TaxID=1866326 RepID=A0AAE9ZBK0_9PROT|nr:ion channel [Hyphococcus flavus]WDI31734.1 ion channel [Hyphococcus flavus]